MPIFFTNASTFTKLYITKLSSQIEICKVLLTSDKSRDYD